jgi:hypothetical protein
MITSNNLNYKIDANTLKGTTDEGGYLRNGQDSPITARKIMDVPIIAFSGTCVT